MFILHLERKPGFYIWNVAFQLFVLVFIGLTALVLPPTDLSDRVQIILTLLLTAAAYKLYLGEHLPKANFLTLLDKYVQLCIVLLSVLAVEAPVVFLAEQAGWSEPERLHSVERGVVLVMLVLWTSVHGHIMLRHHRGDLTYPTRLHQAVSARLNSKDIPARLNSKDIPARVIDIPVQGPLQARLMWLQNFNRRHHPALNAQPRRVATSMMICDRLVRSNYT
jgi:hypothetical protein